MQFEHLLAPAEAILRHNWRGAFTVPTHTLYPFQWNWDSGFVSLGLAHFDVDMAIQELESLLSGQWENGMVPHIVFHSETEKTYFPNWDFWNSNANKGAPAHPKTSGISQPPVLGFVLETLWERFPDNPKIKAFVKKSFPKIVKYHRFFYRYRDPLHEGLFFLYHPWESGRDNSPIWDESMNRITFSPDEIPTYTRRDTKVADASERPTSHQYDRYVYLLEFGKKHGYDGDTIAKDCPFRIQDSMMNAILIKSNESLIRLGKHFGFDTAEIEEWQQQSIRSYNQKMWNEELQFYVGYDLVGKKQVTFKEIGGLVPLFAGIPSQNKAKTLRKYLNDLHRNGYFICPSFDPESPLFDSKRYWRGPIWPQMNWMLYFGLKKYGFNQTAEIVRKDFLHLVDQCGFYEYFEAQKVIAKGLEKGYGGGQFSWTASSVIDLIKVGKR